MAGTDDSKFAIVSHMSLILSKDAALYYEEYGSGESLILVHDFLGSLETEWRRFIPMFARHFHTIAFDLRGHGKTNNPSGKLHLKTLVDDLHVLYDTLQIEQANICGNGFGGYIALAYGLQHPGRVRGLIMHGTRFFWNDVSTRAALEHLEADDQRKYTQGNTQADRQLLLAEAKECLVTISQEAIPEDAVTLTDFPVLVSIGDLDEMIPRNEAEQLAQMIPNARLSVLENTRHPLRTVQSVSFLERAVTFFNAEENA
jgi:pimeloyl-ACP methyl ester carboxylesterase